MLMGETLRKQEKVSISQSTRGKEVKTKADEKTEKGSPGEQGLRHCAKTWSQTVIRCGCSYCNSTLTTLHAGFRVHVLKTPIQAISWCLLKLYEKICEKPLHYWPAFNNRERLISFFVNFPLIYRCIYQGTFSTSGQRLACKFSRAWCRNSFQ